MYYRYLKHYENVLRGWLKYSQALEFSKLSYYMFNKRQSTLHVLPNFIRAKLMHQKAPSDPIRKGMHMNHTSLRREEKKLKCSVCNELVLGLKIYCNNCEHGGHPSHLTKWFQNQDQCPACYNCHCSKYNLY